MAVFRRGKVWWYDFRFGSARIRESAKVSTRREALQAEAIRKAELALGQGRVKEPAPSPRFIDFANGEFAQWSANEHKDRPSTYIRYMTSIKALRDFFGKKSLDTIDSGCVERYKLHRSQQRRKNARDGRLVTSAAVNRDLAVLRILFNYAIRLRMVSRNPVSEVKFLKENNLHMRVLSPEEEDRYLRVASPLLRDVALLILETGMRPGEVYRLRVGDVALKEAHVRVREGKTIYARRTIPLTRRAATVLQGRVASATSEWLFPSRYDPNRPVAEVRKAHHAAVQRSGIAPCFRLYDLRHTALSRMAMAGIDLPTLKEIAGHSQIQMTMRYVHPTPEHKRKAIEKFQRFGEGASNY